VTLNTKKSNQSNRLPHN